MHKILSSFAAACLLSLLTADYAATSLAESLDRRSGRLSDELDMEVAAKPLEAGASGDLEQPLLVTGNNRVAMDRRRKGPRRITGRAILSLSAVLLLTSLVLHKLKSRTQPGEVKSSDKHTSEEDAKGKYSAADKLRTLGAVKLELKTLHLEENQALQQQIQNLAIEAAIEAVSQAKNQE